MSRDNTRLIECDLFITDDGRLIIFGLGMTDADILEDIEAMVGPATPADFEIGPPLLCG